MWIFQQNWESTFEVSARFITLNCLVLCYFKTHLAVNTLTTSGSSRNSVPKHQCNFLFKKKKEDCLSMYVNVYLFCIFIRISCIKSAILIIVHYFVQIKLFWVFLKSPQNFVPLKSTVIVYFS